MSHVLLSGRLLGARVDTPPPEQAKRQLYKAMEEMQDQVDFQVKWVPYFLDPDLVKGREVAKRQAYAQKLGETEAERMVERLTNAFEEVGVKYNHDGLTANTLDAHRLIEWAQDTAPTEKRDALVEALFSAYFEKAQNVGDHAVLVAAAESAGLDPVKAKEILSSDEYERNIDQKMWVNKTRGIEAVPTFIFQGKFKFAGARSVDLESGRQMSQSNADPAGPLNFSRDCLSSCWRSNSQNPRLALY